MGVIGSIGINIGQNLQATGMQALPENQRSRPCVSKLWRVGTATFISFALINFSALALAPASVLTPLESIQFVTNIIYVCSPQTAGTPSMTMLTHATLTLLAESNGEQEDHQHHHACRRRRRTGWHNPVRRVWCIKRELPVHYATAAILAEDSVAGLRGADSHHRLLLPDPA